MRAVARLGAANRSLYGEGPYEASRIDSFLDVSLVFARDAQIYLLGFRSGAVSTEIHALVAPPLPVHLAGQQLLARVLSEGRVSRAEWPQMLARVFTAAGIDRRDLVAALEHAVETDIVRDEAGLLSIGPVGEEIYGFRHFMDVVSLFLTAPLLTVRFGRREIGTVDPGALSRRPGGGSTVLLLGGRPWAVRDVDWAARLVWVEPSDDAGRIRWSGDGRSLSFELCQAQRSVLAGSESGVEALLTRRGQARLSELRTSSVRFRVTERGLFATPLQGKRGGGHSPAAAPTPGSPPLSRSSDTVSARSTTCAWSSTRVGRPTAHRARPCSKLRRHQSTSGGLQPSSSPTPCPTIS